VKSTLRREERGGLSFIPDTARERAKSTHHRVLEHDLREAALLLLRGLVHHAGRAPEERVLARVHDERLELA